MVGGVFVVAVWCAALVCVVGVVDVEGGCSLHTGRWSALCWWRNFGDSLHSFGTSCVPSWRATAASGRR